MVEEQSGYFYGSVTDSKNHVIYLKSNCKSVEEFKNKARLFYSTNVDNVDAYNLSFNIMSNGPLPNTTRQLYIEI